MEGIEILKDYIQTISGFDINVKLLLLRTFLVSMYTGIYGIIFNLYILDMGYRADFLGLVLSVHLIASSVASIPAGILCDRMDKKTLMVVFGLLSILATLPMFLVPSPVVLLISSALSGVFVSITSVIVTPMLAENSKNGEIVHIFSANASLGWIASVIGCAMGGFLPVIWSRWDVLLKFGSLRFTLLASMMLLLVGWAFLLMLRNKRDTKCSCPEFSIADIRLTPDILKFTLTSITYGVGSGMIVPYFNVYFIKVLDMSLTEISITSAVAGAVMVLGFLITPVLTSRIGKVRSAVLTKLLSTPFLVLMAMTSSFILASVAYVLYMFFINMAGPATTSFQMEQIRPEEQGFAVGLMSTGSCLAVSASTYVSGILISRGDYILPFAMTCAAYLVTAGLLYSYFKDVERVPVPVLNAVPCRDTV